MNTAGVRTNGPSYWLLPKDMVPNWPKALCIGKPPQWWDHGVEAELYHLARQVCQACPVMFECRTWAERHKETGMWGGRVFSTGRVVAMYRTGSV